jgi:hypothetical protein
LSESDILALRTDRGFARRAAEAFSRDNMDFLADKGLQPTFGHLRLAFLLGPSAAAKVMQAAPTRPVSHILDGSVIVANPFMRGMTVADLVARATRDVSPKGQPAGGQQIARAEPTAPAAVAPAAVATPPADQPAAVAEAGPSGVAQPEPSKQVADAGSAPAAPPDAANADAGPAPAASAAKEQPPAPAGVDATRTAARSTKAASVKRTASHQTGGKIVINVTCNERLPSCRRWINEQVNKAMRTHTAADNTRRGA